MHSSRRALTLLELLVCIVVIGVLIAIVLPATGRARVNTHQMKDSTQIRGIHQGFILVGNSNNDSYFVPSELDKTNTTLTSDSAKDDPGNVLSILLFNGFFSPELTVSPAEQSPLIQVHQNYALSKPPAAAGPNSDQALWDPTYRGSPAEQVVNAGTKPVGTLAENANVTAHNSYAMMPFFGARRSKWTNTFQANEAILGNRGPTYEVRGTQAKATYRLLNTGSPAAVGDPAGFTSVTGKGTSSITLAIHGGRNTWEGNIAYNDNHVNFETRADPENNPWRFTGLSPASSQSRPDNLFLAEDDATVTPLPAQIGTMAVPPAGPMPPGTIPTTLMTSNNWLKTWTVERVNQDDKPPTTSAITVVVD
jgi:prepilin-type N-terminal cleavage/methylation domain-containing protein